MLQRRGSGAPATLAAIAGTCKRMRANRRTSRCGDLSTACLPALICVTGKAAGMLASDFARSCLQINISCRKSCSAQPKGTDALVRCFLLSYAHDAALDLHSSFQHRPWWNDWLCHGSPGPPTDHRSPSYDERPSEGQHQYLGGARPAYSAIMGDQQEDRGLPVQRAY